jgi:S1-C subfamily serine protease
MAYEMQSPILSGQIKTKARPFERVVRDVRQTVFSVIRHRQTEHGVISGALGSGFFVSPRIFVTCCHVVNSRAQPHQDGDTYHLVGKVTRDIVGVHEIPRASIGNTVHLYPDVDLALLVSDANANQAFAAVDYGEAREGKDIGVAGYPLPRLVVNPQGQLTYDGLVFRVARGIVTASYETRIKSDQGELTTLPVIEVNFLFVPGNSGGPIFDAETGRVMGYVHGYSAIRIRESIVEAELIADLPPDVGKQYIESVHAVYSIGIKLEKVRAQLEVSGVSL